jgi:hypothetical protein
VPVIPPCSGQNGITIGQLQRLQFPDKAIPGCSSQIATILFHAAISGGNIDTYTPNAMVCFRSAITVGPSITMSGNQCFVFTSGAAPPNTDSPYHQPQSIDPSQLKGLMVGYTNFTCGVSISGKTTSCPSGGSSAITWTLTAYVVSGTVTGLNNLRWQYSPTAFLVDPASFDLGSTLIYSPGENFGDSSCLGFPTSQTSCHVGGANGGGGANYCGSNSGTGNVCQVAAPTPALAQVPMPAPSSRRQGR